jgi:hypothetical protein
MMENNHLNSDSIFKYVSGKMSPEEETSVQKHISECPECRNKLRSFRSLSFFFSEKESKSKSHTFFLKIYHNTYFRIAAVLVVVLGIGFGIYKSRPTGFPIQEGVSPENVFSTDTFPQKKDSTCVDCDSLAVKPECYK